MRRISDFIIEVLALCWVVLVFIWVASLVVVPIALMIALLIFIF